MIQPQSNLARPRAAVSLFASSRARSPPVLLIWNQLGTLHILEAMKTAGHDITTLFLCGGLSKNPLFVQIHANATGRERSRRSFVSVFFF